MIIVDCFELAVSAVDCAKVWRTVKQLFTCDFGDLFFVLINIFGLLVLNGVCLCLEDAMPPTEHQSPRTNSSPSSSSSSQR